MESKLSIVVANFGGKFDFITSALLNSIKSVYTDIQVLVVGKDIPSQDIDLLNRLQENYPWAKSSPGSLRNILWNQGLKIAKTEWVMFLDADMLLLKNIDNYIEICEELKSDFVFTTRPALPYWLNMGFLLIKKKPDTLAFFDKLVAEQIENIKRNIGAGQYTFQKMLGRSQEQIDEISTCMDTSKIFQFTQSGINFAGISCEKLNNIYNITPITDEVKVVHLKGTLGTVLLEDNKEDRFERFLKVDIFNYSREEVFNMNQRLVKWKAFSEYPDSDFPLDIYKYYIDNQYRKQAMSILYRSKVKLNQFVDYFNKKFSKH